MNANSQTRPDSS